MQCREENLVSDMDLNTGLFPHINWIEKKKAIHSIHNLHVHELMTRCLNLQIRDRNALNMAKMWRKPALAIQANKNVMTHIVMIGGKRDKTGERFSRYKQNRKSIFSQSSGSDGYMELWMYMSFSQAGKEKTETARRNKTRWIREAKIA